MRIALVTEQFRPDFGGAERSAGQIVDGLTARGHTVTVLAGGQEPGLPHDVRVCPSGAPRKGRSIPPFVKWVEQQLGEFDVSMSVATWLPADVLEPRSGIMAESQRRFLARRKSFLGRVGKRLEYAVSPKHVRMLSLERAWVARAKRIVAISRYMQEQLVEHYAVDPSRIRLIRNGAEIDAPSPESVAEVRARFADVPLFLFVAHDPWRKGIQPLVRAVRKLAFDCRLVVLGRENRHLQEQVRDEPRIVLAGETLNLAPWYAAATATVLPSYYDPASKVVIESLLLGTPAITTAFNGARDFVDGGPLCGRVIDDPDDIEALAAAMTALRDPAERARCSEAARSIAADLPMSRHVAQLEIALAEVAGTK